MSEWLTTGQMIDRLRVGEVAEDKFGKYTAEFEKGNIQIYLVTETFGTIEKRRYGDALSRNILGLEWWILPKYVSFEEAMKAVKDGYTVQYHNGVPTEKKITPFEAGHHRVGITSISECSLLRLYEGKWTIEGDS